MLSDSIITLANDSSNLLDRFVSVSVDYSTVSENIPLREWLARQVAPSPSDQSIVNVIRRVASGDVADDELRRHARPIRATAEAVLKDTGPFALQHVVKMLCGPKAWWSDKFRREFIRAAKLGLSAVMVSIAVPQGEKHADTDIADTHSGLYVFDADVWQSDEDREQGWKDLCAHPSVVACWVSSSGTDFAVVVAGPQATTKEHHLELHQRIKSSLPAYISEANAIGQNNFNRLRFASFCTSEQIYLNESAVSLDESALPDLSAQAIAEIDIGADKVLLAYSYTAWSLLEGLDRLGYIFRFNERSHSEEVKPLNKKARNKILAIPNTVEQPNGWVDLSNDHLMAHFFNQMQRFEYLNAKNEQKPFVVKAQIWKEWLLLLGTIHHRDPFQEWIETLDPWDGTDYFAMMYPQAFGCPITSPDDAAYLAHAARLIVLPCLARTYHPGVHASTITVDVGRQGKGKSWTKASLFPTAWQEWWFNEDVHLGLSKKELVEVMAGIVLGELSELAGLAKADREKVKSMLSATRETGVRLAWRMNSATYPRSWGLVGTANETGSGILPDDIENRRFWPVEIPDTADYAHAVGWITANRAQLWAQALAEYTNYGVSAWRNPPQLFDYQRELTRTLAKTPENILAIADNIESSMRNYPGGKPMAELMYDIQAFGDDKSIAEVAVALSHGQGKTLTMDLAAELIRRGWVKKRASPTRYPRPVEWFPPVQIVPAQIAF